MTTVPTKALSKRRLSWGNSLGEVGRCGSPEAGRLRVADFGNLARLEEPGNILDEGFPVRVHSLPRRNHLEDFRLA
jgi:hypothetical protein